MQILSHLFTHCDSIRQFIGNPLEKLPTQFFSLIFSNFHANSLASLKERLKSFEDTSYWNDNQKLLKDWIIDYLNHPSPSNSLLFKEILKEMPEKFLDDLIKDVIKELITKNRFEKIRFSAHLIGLGALEKLSKFLNNTNDLDIKFIESMTPERFLSPKKKLIESEINEVMRSLKAFLPLLLNIFLGFFAYYSPDKWPKQLWEFTNFIDIHYKLAHIPYVMTSCLRPILISPLKTYSATFLLSLTLSISAFVYLRCLKPTPSDLPYLRKISNRVRAYILNPTKTTFPRKEENEIIATLNTGRNVLLKGLSGAGKTTQIDRLAQLIVENKLNNREVLFLIPCGDLPGSVSASPAEKLKEIVESIEGFEEKVILVLDEFQALMKDTSSQIPEALKNLITNETNGIRWIIIITDSDYKKYVENDAPFAGRAKVINLDQPTPKELKAILKSIVLERKVARLSEEAFDEIIKLTNEHGSKEEGQPRKAENFLKDLMGEFEVAWQIPPIQSIVHEKEAELSERKQNFWLQTIGKKSDLETNEEMSKLSDSLKELKLTLEKETSLYKAIYQFFGSFDDSKKQWAQFIHELQDQEKTPSQKASIKEVFLLYHHFVLPLIDTIISEKYEEIKKNYVENSRKNLKSLPPLLIDKEFVLKFLKKPEAINEQKK